jgi:hypothetical protein
MAYVYRHIRLDTNAIFYIGIGTASSYKRARTIVRRNVYWKNIVSKTKWDYEIIFDDISLEHAKEKEIEFIKFYGRKDKGEGTLCNLTDGGDATTGYIVKNEVKQLLSEINKGKKLSKEHKSKISESHKGKIIAKESIDKMRLAKIGKKQSAETIEKRRKKLIGNKSNTGKTLPESQKEKMKLSQKLRREREKQGI